MEACGAFIRERSGSRAYIELSGVGLHVRKFYPQIVIRKVAVESMRRILVETGILSLPVAQSWGLFGKCPPNSATFHQNEIALKCKGGFPYASQLW